MVRGPSACQSKNVFCKPLDSVITLDTLARSHFLRGLTLSCKWLSAPSLHCPPLHLVPTIALTYRIGHSCWYISSPVVEASGGGAERVVLHRRYECRCYSGPRPCGAGIIRVAARRTSTAAAPAVEGDEDARALADRSLPRIRYLSALFCAVAV